MSWWEDVKEAALQYRCEYCGAEAGEHCIGRPSGQRARYLHGARTQPISQVSRMAWEEGKDEILDAYDEAANYFNNMLKRRRKERNA